MNQLIQADVISIDSVEAEAAAFDLAQRKAKIYASSSLVPQHYQNNVGNVLIAENMAMRMKADPLMVMQNLYVVHGNPGWSSKFLIACFNSCGRFSAIKYRFTGDKGKPSWGCIAYATELSTGEEIEGTEITLAMAKAEGWSEKKGSKWKTMPEQMLRYRAASFLIRTTAPEIGMGLMTDDEIRDSTRAQIVEGSRAASLDDLAEKLEAPEADGEPEDDKPTLDQLLTDIKAHLAEAEDVAAVDAIEAEFISKGLDPAAAKAACDERAKELE